MSIAEVTGEALASLMEMGPDVVSRLRVSHGFAERRGSADGYGVDRLLDYAVSKLTSRRFYVSH